MCLQSSIPPSLLLAFFLLLSSATAFNITKVLSQHPDFSTFNNYLTQTQLNSEINSRRTITILVVDNGAMSSLSGKPTDVIKKVLSLHVVLDYYDLQKLQHLQNKSTIITTLFQTSGQATGQQGFLNVAAAGTGGVSIASAVQGSGAGANLIKEVVSQPYNISVVQISSAIVPSGIVNSSSPTPSPPSPSPHASPSKPPSAAPPKSSKAPTPVPPRSGRHPKPSDAPSNAPSADAPTDAEGRSAAAPTTAADSPKVTSAPSPVDANGPIADAPATEVPHRSIAAKLGTSFAVVMTILFSVLFVASTI